MQPDQFQPLPPNPQPGVQSAPVQAAPAYIQQSQQSPAAPQQVQQPATQLPRQPASSTPQNPVPVTPKNPNSAQNSLLISEIRDNMVVMSDGSFRAVVACQSINFDLMSTRERDGIEYSYQNFLNSLYFPIQIFIRSQAVDIAPYLEYLSKIRSSQDNMLLGVLMDDYIDFIDVLSQDANIMDKSFFVAVPYFSTGDINSAVHNSKNLLSSLFVPQKQMHIKIDAKTYDKAKEEVGNRCDAVINGLSQVGVRAVRMETRMLGELYYNVYNPDTAIREPMGDFRNFTGTFVAKGQGQAPNQNTNEVQP